MHEGHRKRMYEKLRTDSDSLYDHELLEIALFYAQPRKNTNPIAHSLIESYGSLSGVFSADTDSLLTVDGVGDGVANFIKVMSDIFGRINNFSGIAVLKNYSEFLTFTAIRMRGRIDEVLELYFLEKNGRVKRMLSFTSGDTNKVEVDTDKISSAIAAEKPYGLLIAHNHLSGNSQPSLNDDRFTMEVQLICSMNNVCLYDHCIYASDANMYSYYKSGKIDEIKKNFSFKEVVDKQLKNSLSESDDKKQN